MNKSLLLKTLALIATLFCATAYTIAEEKPEIKFQNTILELVDVLSDNNPDLSFADKQQNVIELFKSRNFEFDTIIRRTLGRNWTTLTDEQKEQTKQLITTMLLLAYSREFQDGEKPEMKFGEATFLNPKQTKLELPSAVKVRGSTVTLSYRLVNLKAAGWQVYDILVEGVSMVSNYRKQFDDHFNSRKSADELIELLKGKLAD
ncbi:ABC transporter substrate-binding protein [Puniceicoccaceae bacterium K14]|nr:ABC transporter substrate-binding protein [Puniceicoccaceae bacterium K14]